MDKIFVPPIKIQGKKTKLVPWIIENVDFNKNGRWVEPFFGSGVVGFNFGAKKSLFCDINPHIINFYNAIKKGEITSYIAKQFLIEQGKILSEKGEDHYWAIRERFNSNGNPLDFLFLNRSCFNGMIRFNRKKKFNAPYGHKPKRFSQAYITKIINQIKYTEYAIRNNDWEFKCQDFRVTLKNLSEDDFVYCDPPYIGRHVDYFDTWTEKDERELNCLLSELKAKFILSTWHSNRYRSNKFIETIWKNFNILTIEHFYHIGAKEKNRNGIIEALIMNYKSNPVCQSRQIGTGQADKKPEILKQKKVYQHANLFETKFH